MGRRTIQVFGFPSTVSANDVTDFLEKQTGVGTICALKVRPPKIMGPKSKAFVIVQFTSSKHAEETMSKAQSLMLVYGASLLTVKEGDRDIIPKPRTILFNIEQSQAVLHIGCPVSDDRFSVLWKVANVEVQFGFGLRKLEFFFPYDGLEYKLELFYDSIWQIQLRRPHYIAKKFLLIQLQACPRIYKKVAPRFDNIYENPFLNYYKDTPEDQWVRAIDFTCNRSIGQSSALCLELPKNCKLPDISEYFFYFKENNGQFILEGGYSFCHRLDLVPIVEPHRGIRVPYTILFKVNSLLQNGIIMGPTLDDEFFNLVDPFLIDRHYIDYALETLSHQKEICFEPSNWLLMEYKKYIKLKHRPRLSSISLDPGLVYVHRVQVTPSKIYFCGPEVNVSNRVLREYSMYLENFIRISFVDEEWDKIRSIDLVPRSRSLDSEKHTGIYKRICSTLKNGIVIGDKKFEFLAFSSSQLRESSAWMFASINGVTAENIRQWMGDFSEIRNVAKYAARLGQSFGSSKETLTVTKDEVELIPDIETSNPKYNFSDGIGKISSNFARRVALKCDLRSTPSAFQIRYGGYKGVVAVDPKSRFKLSLRKSMSKYNSDNTKLDVLAWSKYQPCFLNRQLITLLSTLGIKDHVFEMKQKEAIDQLDLILTDSVSAQEALEMMAPGENTRILKEMLLCGYKPNGEPFLSMMLQAFRASKLWELRTKTRIFVRQGRALMGCLDETGSLKYGQIFVNVSSFGRKQFYDDGLSMLDGEVLDQSVVIVERVFVAKNPCLHPGDVRLLQAVDVPALHHMVDCVVFPQKGRRPHPNECSGSDLDGDIYFVCWDHALIPPLQCDPMNYMPAPTEILDHDVQIEEVVDYFSNYMVNESLGIIANAHTAFADQDPEMAKSDRCMELAKLFSVAVDFPKTGVPAEIPPHLYVKVFPDFMEKPDKPDYESQRVIGKLFRAIKYKEPNVGHISSFTRDVARKSYDVDMEVDGFEDYIEDAIWYKEQYDFKLGNLMDYYGIKTEAEILSGSILKMRRNFSKRNDSEAISLAVRSLKKEVRAWFDEKGSQTDPDVDDDPYAKASAWYHVTYHPAYWEIKEPSRGYFISFPWCVYGRLIHIKQKKKRLRTLSLQNDFEKYVGLS